VTRPVAQIIVIGAGAIGSFLAGLLHLAGEPVLLVARGHRLESLCRDGLRFSVDEMPSWIDLPVVAGIEGAAPARLVLFCTKAGDLTGALELAAPVVGAQTALLLVQNGVEAPALVQARFPGTTVIASRVHGFFELVGGFVRHVGVAPSLELGAIGPDPEAMAQEVAELFNRSGIEARCAIDIEASLWSKFLLAASLGGVALACGLPAGEVPRDSSAKAMLAAAMAEVHSLAQAKGVALPPDVIATAMAFVATFPAGATTSLQRDVMLGRSSEYDFLPGAVLRLGSRDGVPTPCFESIYSLVAKRWAPSGVDKSQTEAGLYDGDLDRLLREEDRGRID
jgi:2-dehydropantoate 2-reductase